MSTLGMVMINIFQTPIKKKQQTFSATLIFKSSIIIIEYDTGGTLQPKGYFCNAKSAPDSLEEFECIH